MNERKLADGTEAPALGHRAQLDHTAVLEDLIVARTQELAAALTELEAFTYSVAHDLRAPLRAINGFSQALMEDHASRLDGEALDYLHRIRRASTHMAQLIDDLLKLSRINRGELDRQEVDVSALVHRLARTMAERHKGRTMRVDVQDGVVVHADTRLLAIALENLLDNAWKFTRPQAAPEIRFSVAEQGGTRVFAVADNGVGFDMRYRHKLFAPFQRLHRDDEFEGTGIGLATVSRVVARHGGEVWIECMPGKGTTVSFTLAGEKPV